MGFFEGLAEGFGKIATQVKNITVGPSDEYKAEQIENWQKAKAKGGTVGDSLIIKGNDVSQDFSKNITDLFNRGSDMSQLPMLVLILIAVLLLRD